MHSGNHKYGRGGGGGRGAGKKNVFTPPAPARISSSSSSGRLSLGGGSRNPPPTSAPTSSSETFSLVGGREPLSYAALIRLAPDLVEEIKRVEAQGGAAKIKFDPNPNNPLGNVIDVGGKEFRFTWSHETGGLCDIYEERQSGEDGNGLLVESGCAWRKLNVQRVLDESAKNRVKMLSEEAERNLKSRKAKLLDPSNGSMKSQMKALAASEVNPWKFKQNNFKKRNFEPSEVGRPPKSIDKSGFPSSGTTKGRHSFSPLPSPPNQSSSLASPSMRGNVTETLSVAEDTTHIQPRTKENTVSAKKDSSPRSSDRLQEASAHRDDQVEGAKDAQNLLIILLKDNPKGLSIKAVADRTSNPVRKIEPLLKKIATFDSSGVYILKPGIEVESQKLPPSDNGSSPEDDHQKQYFTEGNLGSTLASDFTLKSPPEDLEEQLPVSEPDLVKKIDASQHFTELFGDDDPPDNSEGQAAISRESGSGSDSDSSDSGSDTRSRSRSRSPAGTASRSGSDSGNESSSHSKGSDMEIDILNKDDEEPKKLHDTHDGLSGAPIPWSMSEAGPLRVGNLGDQEGYASEDIDIDIDIDNDFRGDNEAELASASHVPVQFTEKLKSVSPGHEQTRLYGVADKRNEPEDHSDSLTRSKGLSKRGSDVIQFEENSEVIKRLKTGSMAQSSVSPRSSPDLTNEDHHDNNNMQISGTSNRNDFSGLQRGYNSAGPGKSASELLQSGQRPPLRSHDIETADKNVKNPRFRGLDAKKQETNAYKLDGFRKQGDKGRGETRDGEFGLHDKVNGKFKEGTSDKKQDVQPEPNYEKHCEEGKKFHATGNSAKLQVGSSLKDGGRADLDRAFFDRRLQRELSDLELGELREPLEEPDVTKKQFERVGSLKQSDAKSSTFGSQNSDLKGRPSGKLTIDMGSPSLPNSRAGSPKSSDDWFKRTSPEPFSADTNRISHRPVQSQHQQSRVSCAEGVSLSNKAADLDRLEHNEGAANQGPDAEGYGESQKKSHVSAHVEEPKQDLGSRKTKGNKSLKHKSLANGIDKRKDVSSIEGRKDKRKRSESSLDEDASYSKYEKEEPELKGLIITFSQYKEYVQEYSEKYEIYSSLNKILEDYRIEFQKLGMDLDRAKSRDMEKYHNISAQLRESYRRCGARHKRLKKIFIVLHEELKVLKQRIKDFALDYMKD